MYYKVIQDRLCTTSCNEHKTTTIATTGRDLTRAQLLSHLPVPIPLYAILCLFINVF